MNRDQFLNTLAPLTFAQRMKKMVEAGRASRSDPALARLLEQLRQGGTFERFLAITACYGSRDGAHALAALRDPSRLVRGSALKVAALACNDAQIAEGLASLAPRARYKLLLELRKQKRQAPVDAYVSALTPEDVTLAALLSLASPEVVAARLPALAEQPEGYEWARLAKRHPGIVAQALTDWANRLTHANAYLAWMVWRVTPLLAESAPDAALAVVRALARTTPLNYPLLRLPQRRPDETVTLLLERGEFPAIGAGYSTWNALLPRLSPHLRRALLETRPDLFAQGASRALWLRKLPPEARADLWAHFALAWRESDGTTPEGIVALLPAPLRIAEARRHVALPLVAADPPRLMRYAALLPWDEARTLAAEWLTAQEGELRAVAWHALAGAVRYERTRLAELLALMQQRRYEQDPVRNAMLFGLTQIPAHVYAPDHLTALSQIFRDALNSSDLSAGSAQQIGTLLLALLPLHTDWAVDWLTQLTRARGQVVAYGNPLRHLPDALARRLITALLPVFDAWQARERERPLLMFAQRVGRKLELVEPFLAILEKMVRETVESDIAVQSLELLLKHDRPRAARLIPELVARDGSWVTRYPVSSYLHRHRQELLTPFLGQTVFKGRWSTGKTRFVLPFMEGFHRWTPSQQEIFARALTGVVSDSERDIPAAMSTVTRLGALLYLPPDRLVHFARDPREPVRVAALRALGRYDSGQGVPTLLDALNDERARYAIYELRRALLEMPVEEARAILSRVPTEKVTIAKEVVRLLGELRSESAYQELLAWNGRDLHRNVRVALVNALWHYLEQEETWAILRAAAQSEIPALAAITARTPDARLTAQGQVRLLELLALLLAHPKVGVRQRVLERLIQLPVNDGEGRLLAPLESALLSTTPQETQLAANALITTYAERDPARTAALIARLLPRPPALRRVLDALAARVRHLPARLLPLTRAVLDVLAQDSRTGQFQAHLLASALPWDEIPAALQQLHERGALHYEGVKAIEGVLAWRTRQSDGESDGAERALAAHPDGAMRHIGLLLLRALGDHQGWTEERIARLQAYRRNNALAVAGAAQFLFWKGEEG